jgi:hypothetical protein
VPTCKDLLRIIFSSIVGGPHYNPEKPFGCFFGSVQGGSLIQHLKTVRVYDIYLFIYFVMPFKYHENFLIRLQSKE